MHFIQLLPYSSNQCNLISWKLVLPLVSITNVKHTTTKMHLGPKHSTEAKACLFIYAIAKSDGARLLVRHSPLDTIKLPHVGIFFIALVWSYLPRASRTTILRHAKKPALHASKQTISEVDNRHLRRKIRIRRRSQMTQSKQVKSLVVLFFKEVW